MRSEFKVLAMIALLGSPALFAEQRALGQASNIKPRTVTLLARKSVDDHDNYTSAVFSFRFGCNGDDAVSLTRNDWDLLYGNISLNGDRDWFSVALAGDDRSRIRDLGELNWSDDIPVPVLAACPEEGKSCTAVIFPARSTGQNLTDVNLNLARAALRHMYVVHTRDRVSDFYALFRVEELNPSESCTISWKLIPSPEN